GANYQWPGHPDSGPARHRGRGAALWRRHHHAGHFRAFRHGGPQARHTPALDNFVLPLTLVILIALFAIQRRGTASIGRLFGPVMVIWFVTIAVLGIVNIWHAPAILKALNPVEATRVVATDPVASVAVIGAVFLVLTGGEALYADMGHVGAAAIRRAWFGLVLPALLLCYFGQGALVLIDPKAVENPFYSMAPSWALIPLIALATAATIIASQSLIS